MISLRKYNSESKIWLKKALLFAVYCTLILPGVVPGVTAQNNEITFKHLSTVDGLSNFTVLAIAQDHRGFMWFGTMDGLNRYDGKNIKIYNEDPEVPYSLGSSYIWSLLTAGDSGMWVDSNRLLLRGALRCRSKSRRDKQCCDRQ